MPNILRKIFTATFFMCIGTFLIAQNNFFEIGIGRYEQDQGYSNYSIHAGMSKSLNNWLNIEGNVIFNMEDEQTFIIFPDPFPSPEPVREVTMLYESYQANLQLDIYLFGFVKNMFQTHLKAGGGIYGQTNEWVKPSGIIGLEEVVKVSPSLAGVIGYSYTMNEQDYVQRLYFGVRRMF